MSVNRTADGPVRGAAHSCLSDRWATFPGGRARAVGGRRGGVPTGVCAWGSSDLCSGHIMSLLPAPALVRAQARPVQQKSPAGAWNLSAESEFVD